MTERNILVRIRDENILFNIDSLNQRFSENYRLVFSFDSETDEKTVLSDTEPCVCRFCGKTTPEVKFNKIAHAIPEMLNNKLLFSSYECDTCNELFGNDIENELAKMLLAYRAVRQLKKKGSGTVQMSKDLKFEYKNGNFNVSSNGNYKASDALNVHYDTENKRVFINSIARYTPERVFKSFVKMMLSVMGKDDFLKASWAKDWAMDAEKHSSRALFMWVMVLKESIEGFQCRLFTLKSGLLNLPYFVFQINFDHIAFCIYMPANDRDFDTSFFRENEWFPTNPTSLLLSALHVLHDMNDKTEIVKPQKLSYSYGNLVVEKHE